LNWDRIKYFIRRNIMKKAIHEDIVIAEIDGNPVLLDLILPESDKPTPVIIHIHGGGWVGGDHKSHRFQEDLMMRGWALADLGYRLSGQAPFPDKLEDCHTAVRFLRANAAKYNLDPERIGVFGFSAGGHLAALLGATENVAEFQTTGGYGGISSAVQAVVVANGPTDIPSIFALTKNYDVAVRGIMENSGKFTPEQIETVSGHGFGDGYKIYKLFLGDREPLEAKELCESASVMQYVTEGMPPYYIIQSDADDAVPVGHALKLYIAMKEAGADVELKIVPYANHGLCNSALFVPNDYATVDRIFDFYAEKMGIEGYDPGNYPKKDNNF